LAHYPDKLDLEAVRLAPRGTKTIESFTSASNVMTGYKSLGLYTSLRKEHKSLTVVVDSSGRASDCIKDTDD
jgi:hypothetical protein